MTNVEVAEVNKFSELAHQWWDQQGVFKPLHQLNPLRLDYIDNRASLQGKQVLDVGCGGGILSESMAQRGAQVTGIDLAEKSLQVAQLHALDSGVQLEYRCVAVEALAEEQPQTFDVVTCMEMLEHVPDPSSVVRACARLVKPGGHVFFSTLNRNAKAYLMAVVGAEYVLNLLPKGTHDYSKFIKPSELAAWMRASGLELQHQTGVSYHPLNKQYALTSDTSVNYMLHAIKDL
ncbi:bifunctional 2-polyprenyl-6-hydroxyphenol methylase/3-demethylubiquinol 3-O-methyltransferase UbiG [Methylophilus medardicus]|uniref:Ubiquinone biosynthesis O-methyltransferase n=1 Tax=Methylophilus medardicus TaxID=2588534 RepID=A0A5B8CSD9_9PROT|nr:bifunctional 2-polyprenyl-6-hydroxyphenol methylase/3-demethylubiquinol 3-O-methyltransferase UbiG [Methylophilus medardicus]QDC44050.1 bifunctional 2-polyprenyl-6-hydroxyphenol methylase/3-demethylubiquinol 3-O-methyltransferase UbiG [Methylophilus medardicus]QDC49057.1 bifunctional 2-polyprenyl-6-hydroxyphenol methylase/3-demethylubiquinol 3-O-methyltransferase UbiG [Methylophilus medardicus]QDC52762.1 bifunctional 2-polyprenyl-6-hydroxyphenol methylase/3-demethylubiquinol 3-O-methyltransfe